MQTQSSPHYWHKRFRRHLIYGLLLLLWLGNLAVPIDAEEPQLDQRVYLPLLVRSGATVPPPPSDDPYPQMLEMVQQHCADIALNQVCYANGQVSLQPKSGPADFSQPGARVDLATVESLSLTSDNPDSQTWGVAWLRLQANPIVPTQELTILAYGNVELSNLAVVTAQDAALSRPGLDFSSSPVPGVDKLGSSGLIVSNANENELLSLTLNGAAVTLGSTAVIEAQPGESMQVTMASGFSLIEAEGESSQAIQNQQVSVPLDQSGQATGSPGPAFEIDALDYLFPDLLVPLPGPALSNSALKRLNRSIDRCLAGQSRYVYNVLFWSRVIEREPFLNAHMDQAKLAQAYERARNCLTFNLDFGADVSSLSAPLNQHSEVVSALDSVAIQFAPTGKFELAIISDDLIYDTYTYDPADTGCPITTETTPGRLWISDGELRIVVNKVGISLDIELSEQPTDTVWLNCPGVPPIPLPLNHWTTVFYRLHETFKAGTGLHAFRFTDWEYRVDDIAFADAFYELSQVEGEFTFKGTTLLSLDHRPVQPK